MLRKFSVAVLLLLLVGVNSTTNAGQIASPEHNNDHYTPMRFMGNADTLRDDAITAALKKKDLFDCATYQSSKTAKLPVERKLFSIVQDIQITPEDGEEYLGAIWSPKGDEAVFVVLTHDSRSVADYDPKASNNMPQVVAIGTTKLLLYTLATNAWDEIAADGMRPTWSADGKSIYFMRGVDEMVYDLQTRETISTGRNVPLTGVGLTFSRVLPDGSLLAPSGSNAPLQLQGKQTNPAYQIGVTETDFVLSSPNGEHILVGYGAGSNAEGFVPAIATLYGRDGKVTPLLKNCQYSVTEMAWSPNGNQIAYPVHTDRPEIRIYSIASGQTKVLVRLDTFAHLGDLSWSPDEKYLTFTNTDNNSIWVVSMDGQARQQVVKGGLAPNWSTDGKHILYARALDNQVLGWNLLEINSR